MINEREYVEFLIKSRQKNNLSQQDLANKIGWDVEDIILLESGCDSELQLDEVYAYLNAMDVILVLNGTIKTVLNSDN